VPDSTPLSPQQRKAAARLLSAAAPVAEELARVSGLGVRDLLSGLPGLG
jgi:hypothetical protein